MTNIGIPKGLKGKGLYNYLVANKDTLIQAKKGIGMAASSKSSPLGRYDILNRKDNGVKAIDNRADETTDTIRVKTIANTALWFDADQDVLMPNCWKRSIDTNKSKLVHLHDHIFQLEAKVGEVADVYQQDIPLLELGIDKQGVVQALVFVTDIMRMYNSKIFKMYQSGNIKQHSIGFKYVNIELAINDPEFTKEYALYQSIIDTVINKEDVEEYGFMWIVREIKLFENSAVIWGANELTPTLDNHYSDPTVQVTPNNPLPEEGKAFDIKKAINAATFIS